MLGKWALPSNRHMTLSVWRASAAGRATFRSSAVNPVRTPCAAENTAARTSRNRRFIVLLSIAGGLGHGKPSCAHHVMRNRRCCERPCGPVTHSETQRGDGALRRGLVWSGAIIREDVRRNRRVTQPRKSSCAESSCVRFLTYLLGCALGHSRRPAGDKSMRSVNKLGLKSFVFSPTCRPRSSRQNQASQI